MSSVPTGDVLDALAVVALEVFDDLPRLAPVLVDGDADAAAGGGQGAGQEARELALDVEEADLAEVEQAAVEVEPLSMLPLWTLWVRWSR
jgi:hypothetical protein